MVLQIVPSGQSFPEPHLPACGMHVLLAAQYCHEPQLLFV
jgi:hypothetical protein